MSRSEAGRLLLFALAVVGGLAGLGVLAMHLLADPLADARAYYDAAARLNAGQALYPVDADPNAADFYRYPPLLAIVLRPFALLPYPAFAVAWESVVVASLALLVRRLGAKRQTWLALGLLGVPVAWAVAVGQAQVPLTLLVAIGTPWSIALATNLKLFPALVALWWVGRRDLASLARFGGWLIGLALVQVVLEPAGSNAFLATLGTSQIGEVRNFSPYVIAPWLWAVLLLGGALAVLGLARTRWGWPAAVALATLAPPRLLTYLLTELLAALRTPESAPGSRPGSAPGSPPGSAPKSSGQVEVTPAPE